MSHRLLPPTMCISGKLEGEAEPGLAMAQPASSLLYESKWKNILLSPAAGQAGLEGEHVRIAKR